MPTPQNPAAPVRQPEVAARSTRIKVVGVGGGGSNAIDRMIDFGVEGVEFIALNTDVQALEVSKAEIRGQLGSLLTNGLSAGSDPDIGRRAAIQDAAEIAEVLEGADMVFVTAGLGGGTGTGAAPVIAAIASEMGALTVAIVTRPFGFEGKRRMAIADWGIEHLIRYVDTLIVIPNEKLLAIAKDAPFFESFKIADDFLRQAVQSISDIITTQGVINRDFADVKTTMAGMGYAVMGTASRSGPNRAVDAVMAAMESPLLDEGAIDGARGILINITGSSSLRLSEVNDASSAIQSVAHEDANIIFGAVLDERLGDEVKATVIATGFRKDGRDRSDRRSRLLRKTASETATSAPETTNPVPPEPIVEEPDPIAARPEPIAPKQEPVGTTQEPMTAEPEPAIPEPVALEPVVTAAVIAAPVFSEPALAGPLQIEPTEIETAMAEVIAPEPNLTEPVAPEPDPIESPTPELAEEIVPEAAPPEIPPTAPPLSEQIATIHADSPQEDELPRPQLFEPQLITESPMPQPELLVEPQRELLEPPIKQSSFSIMDSDPPLPEPALAPELSAPDPQQPQELEPASIPEPWLEDTYPDEAEFFEPIDDADVYREEVEHYEEIASYEAEDPEPLAEPEAELQVEEHPPHEAPAEEPSVALVPAATTHLATTEPDALELVAAEDEPSIKLGEEEEWRNAIREIARLAAPSFAAEDSFLEALPIEAPPQPKAAPPAHVAITRRAAIAAYGAVSTPEEAKVEPEAQRNKAINAFAEVLEARRKFVEGLTTSTPEVDPVLGPSTSNGASTPTADEEDDSLFNEPLFTSTARHELQPVAKQDPQEEPAEAADLNKNVAVPTFASIESSERTHTGKFGGLSLGSFLRRGRKTDT